MKITSKVLVLSFCTIICLSCSKDDQPEAENNAPKCVDVNGQTINTTSIQGLSFADECAVSGGTVK